MLHFCIFAKKGCDMQAAFSLNSNELNINFVNSIKEMFQGKNIEIVITDGVDEEYEREKSVLDATLNDYLQNGSKNFTVMSDEFWEDTEKRLIQRHRVS